MEKSIYELIIDQKDKDFATAFRTLELAYIQAERQSKAKDKTISQTARDRHADLGRVLFWFHHGIRADRTKDGHWATIKILAQDFVDRGVLKASIMDTFGRDPA